MTAINIIVQPNAAHVICDGARYDGAGTLLGIGPKCTTLPHIPALMASRGPCQATPIVHYHIAWKYHTFDALVGGIEGTLEDVVSQYGDYFEYTGFPEIELYFVGYSEERQRFMAYFIRTHDPDQTHAIEQVGDVNMDRAVLPDPFTLKELEGAFLCPCLPEDKLKSILAGRDSAEQLDAISDGLKVLEAQRHLKISCRPDSPPAHTVGGLAMVSTVTKTDTVQRVIRRWNEDVIGEPIKPLADASISVLNLPPPGISKLQWDMMERKRRKTLRRAGGR